MKDRIKILKKTEPGMCGGTDATQNEDAPKTIKSENMILFDVTSAFGGMIEPDADEQFGYISAFAAPSDGGTFMFIEKNDGFFGFNAARTYSFAHVKANPFPELAKLVKEFDLAKNNGFHSTTHGLPENFGGSVTIKYESGEKIDFSNNQSPIFSQKFAAAVSKLFKTFMDGEKVKLPDVSLLTKIYFEERRKNGGYTKATLTINEDGTATNEKQSKYDDTRVYESTKPVDAETVENIKRNIVNTGFLSWSGLPEMNYSFLNDKSITLYFKTGEEITVKGNKTAPDRISRGFFNIELEMTTKH